MAFHLCYNCYKHVQKKRKKELTILMSGLDSAGKTTILTWLQGEIPRPADMTSTSGFKKVTHKRGRYDITLYDVGGSKGVRQLWRHYYAEIYGCVFVVDASNEGRLSEGSEVIKTILAEPRFEGKPMLILLNKQDGAGVVPQADIVARLDLASYPKSPQKVLCCTGLPKGDTPDARIDTGFRWLVDEISSQYRELQPRVQRDVHEQKERERIEKEERMKRVEKMREERRRQQEQDAAAAAEAGGAGVGMPAHSGPGPPGDAPPKDSSPAPVATAKDAPPARSDEVRMTAFVNPAPEATAEVVHKGPSQFPVQGGHPPVRPVIPPIPAPAPALSYSSRPPDGPKSARGMRTEGWSEDSVGRGDPISGPPTVYEF